MKINLKLFKKPMQEKHLVLWTVDGFVMSKDPCGCLIGKDHKTPYFDEGDW